MVLAEDLQSLKVIALMGGTRKATGLSSQTLGQALDISPQTASRRLIALEDQQLINRAIRPDGQFVTITKVGEGVLKKEYAAYRQIFEEIKEQYVLEGSVIDGLGEGRYYVALPGYVSQFVEKLGFEPYPGTLNLRLNPASTVMRAKLDLLTWIPVEGFTADGRTFGRAKCLPCRIGDVGCAIIVPGRTHYPEDIIEVIAPVRLREALPADVKDTVSVEVNYGD